MTTHPSSVEPERPARLESALESATDEEIVRRVLAGEPRLYELLMRRHNPRVYRLARGILRNDADAEDAMQEAYFQAYTNLGRFEGRSSFGTWLSRIAINAALARLRRQRAESLVSTPDLDELGEIAAAPENHPMSSQAMAKGPEREVGDRELRSLLEASIDELPEHYRTVFVLRAVEDLSVPETAECLGIPDETVRTRFFRARALLKDHMFARFDGTAREVYELHLSRCDRVVAAVLARIGVT